MRLSVIGGGLAGCEAANAAANLGVKVDLYEMKPASFSPVHQNPDLAELVCSNSLKAERIDSAAGLLKEEMRRMGSITMQAAQTCRVEAGGALAVDRDLFSKEVTRLIEQNPNITIHRERVDQIPEGACVISAGPLCDGKLAEAIKTLCGDGLSFFDAVAPIVTADSVDLTKAFFASRYGKGGDDYLNCSMNKEQYEAFWDALVNAETAPLHEFDQNPTVYEGCMPVEVLAKRGKDAIRFGPLKPVGLKDPNTGHRPWAAVQLRAENREKTLFNLVGFQTNLKFPEQKRVFSMIPGLEHADFMRYGVMHRNSFIDSPRLLNSDLSLKVRPDVFFAGQLSGVEGYTESAMCGILAGYNAAAKLLGKPPKILPRHTMSGALIGYITDSSVVNFQPMGANFGILPGLDTEIRDKRLRYAAFSNRALKEDFL